MMNIQNVFQEFAQWIIFVVVVPFFLPVLCVVFLIARDETLYKQRSGMKPYILWGPHPIRNIKYNSHAVRVKGYKSDTLVYDLYFTAVRNDFDYVFKFFNNIKCQHLFIYVFSYPIFLWVLWKYDIFHFYFNGGYLSYTPLKWFELPIFKAAGKKIVVSPYGGDVTQPSKVKDKYKWNIALFYEEDYPLVNERAVQRKIEYFTRYADYIIGVGELMEYLPRYDIVLPMNSTIDLDEWESLYKERGDVIKIVHAPNHRALKGTKYLITACNELKKEGYPIELVMVEKMTNVEAKKIFEQADIIADQFIIGWYALFAAEGMALGKPVLCFLRDEWIITNNLHEWNCPIVNTSPDTLKANLKILINDEKLCFQLGEEGRAFVERYGMDYVGEKLKGVYEKIWTQR